jgi:hypothetical protein
MAAGKKGIEKRTAAWKIVFRAAPGQQVIDKKSAAASLRDATSQTPTPQIFSPWDMKKSP